MKRKSCNCILTAALISVLMLTGCQNHQSEDMEAYRKIGIDCMENGDYAGAVAAFDSALSKCLGGIGAEELDICYYKAAAQYAGGDIEGAMSTYTALIEYDQKSADAYYLRGSLYLKQGETQAAMADYDMAVKNNPDDYELYISIYENLAGYGMKADGENYLNKAFSIKGNEMENKTYRGEIYYLLGQYDNAATELAGAVEAGSTDAYFYLGQTYEARGEEANAESCYQAFIDSGVANAESLNAIGEIKLKKGSYAEALSYFEQAMNQEEISNKREIMQNLVIAYEYCGDFTSAWNVIQEYVALYPEDVNAQREYLFLQNRQPKEEPVEETETDETETDDVSETDSTEIVTE